MKTKAIVIALVALVLGTAIGFVANATWNGAKEPTLTREEAQTIALKDAKLTENDVTHLLTNLDKDDLKNVYEVSFYDNKNATEYDYDIDANTGDILKSEIEKNPGSGQTAQNANNATTTESTTTATEGSITQDQALDIALKDAQVNKADTTHIDIDKDRERGLDVWNVEFSTATQEYDYDISITDGAIIYSEVDQHDE
mgnify:FL=1